MRKTLTEEKNMDRGAGISPSMKSKRMKYSRLDDLERKVYMERWAMSPSR